MNCSILFAFSFATKCNAKRWIKTWMLTHLQPRANIWFLRRVLFDRGIWQVQNFAETGHENCSDSPKAAFGRSAISTCRRAWWKLRLISCCGKVQIQTGTPLLANFISLIYQSPPKFMNMVTKKLIWKCAKQTWQKNCLLKWKQHIVIQHAVNSISTFGW